MPAEYAAIGQPQGPAPFTLEDLVSIATLVGGIFGNGGGDQLYNAELYENMAKKFGPEHLSVPGSPTVIVKKKAKKKAEDRRTRLARRRPPSTRPASTRPSSARPRSKPTADHSGFATFLSFDDPNDPEAPTTVHKTKFPYQTPARRRARPSRRRSRCPTPAPCRPPTRSSAARLPPARRERRMSPARVTPAWGWERRPTRVRGCSAFHALDVQRAPGQRQGLGQRPPARRDGAPGVLLRTGDPHGGGHPRSRHRRRRRGFPGGQSLRRARPWHSTTRGRRPPRARTSSTPSPSRCATRPAGAVANEL